MPIDQKHPWTDPPKSVSMGADSMLDPNIVAGDTTGEYVDAQNMRPNNVDGDYGDARKIGGEVLLDISQDTSCGKYYGFQFGLGAWRNAAIAKGGVNGRRVELWYDFTDVLDPFIRVDGIIVAASAGLRPFINKDHAVQLDKDEKCTGGLIGFVNDDQPAMILNVQDMLDNGGQITCSEKYFHDFDPGEYIAQLRVPMNSPVFIELTSNAAYPGATVFGAGVVKLGQAAYAIRYVAASGDRSQISMFTGLTPEILNLSTASAAYPSIKSYGGEAGGTGGLGPVIRFRVNNQLNYDYIEVIRVQFVDGQPLGFTPGAEVIGQVPLIPGEVSVKTVVDLGAAGTPITEEEETTAIGQITTAKAIRFYLKRLWLSKVRYASKDIADQIVFLGAGGQEMFPSIWNMGKAGHHDPYNHTYYKTDMSGDKNGWAAVFFDSQFERTFAVPIPNFQNFQMPDRRDAVTGDSLTYAYRGAPVAANNQGVVGPVFEKFDLKDAIIKDDCNSFYNIAADGSKLGNNLCDPAAGTNDLFAGCVTFTPAPDPTECNTLNYHPLTPIGQQDADVAGHNFKINTQTRVVGAPSEQWADYSPQGFAPNYYTMGMMLRGIDMSTVPDWAAGCTIVKTRPAGRVIAQGIGFYSLTPGDFSGAGSRAGKETKQFFFYAPDMASFNGIVDQATIDDISANPNQYTAQLVAPFGFFSEVYGGNNRDLAHDIMDMVCYPRIQHDAGSINFYDGNIGINNYVSFGKWRNSAYPGWAPAGVPANSGKFAIASFAPQTDVNMAGDRGGEYFKMRMTTDIYSTANAGAAFGEYDVTKEWHEPMYLVNVLNESANVPQNDIMEYYDTASTLVFKSQIGIATGNPGQTFQLVDERWEDCIPALDINYPGATTRNSFVYVKVGNTEQLWLNVAFKSAALIALIRADILANGFYLLGTLKIYGVYTHTNIQDRFFTLVFNDLQITLPAGSPVYVRYDNTMPIRVYGGDMTIGEDIFAPIDAKTKADGSPDNAFIMNVGFPFKKWQTHPRMMIVNRAQGGANKIQDCNNFNTDYIRQLACVFNVESKTHVPYHHENFVADDVSEEKFFPATNYVMRPNRWSTANLRDDNFSDHAGIIYPAYLTDYPNEYNIWQYGGFRFLPRNNIDYCHTPDSRVYNSKPTVGFIEELEFCSRTCWSQQQPINVQDVPNLRTFLSGDFFDIDDDQGEIKYLFDSNTPESGNNLWAFTENGICMLLVGKDFITEGNAQQLTLLKSTQGLLVQDQKWVTKSIGMNNQMYRSVGEYNEMLFFANLKSVYKFKDGALSDIGKIKYYDVLYGQGLKHIAGDFTDYVTGTYDIKHGEYWLGIPHKIDERTTRPRTFAWIDAHEHWRGKDDTAFQNYICLNNNQEMYGVSQINTLGLASTYHLDDGFIINGADIDAHIDVPFSPLGDDTVEFIRVRMSPAKYKPTTVEFFTDRTANQAVQARIDPAIVGPLYLKNYGGAWEQYIPRKIAAPRDRVQDSVLIVRINHNGSGDFILSRVSVMYKKIR